MAQSIGEKIKILRKEMNMTQSQLAGNDMTKGMLSLIENGQAFPSMKNLQILSQRLGKPVSYFLDDTEKINNLPVEEISSILKESDILVESRKPETALPRLEKLVLDYKLEEGSLLHGDYLYVLGKCLIYLNKYDEGEALLQKAIDIYMNCEVYIKAVNAYLEFTNRLMAAFKYEEALKIMDKADMIYKKSSDRDIIHEIESLYLKSYIYSAMGLEQKAAKELDEAIRISKESNTFYKTYELYRLKSVIYLMNRQYENFLYSINKAIQFAEFTEDKGSTARAFLNLSMYYLIINDLENARKYIGMYEQNTASYRYTYYIQKAKICYADGSYEKAYELIKKVDYSSLVNHTYDYLLLWSGKIYEGMILAKLNRAKEAIEAVNESISKLSAKPMSAELAFAYKSLSSIYYETGDYKSAYELLNKSGQYKYPVNHMV